ncbi:cytochrome P450 [Streptomyces sp. NPDC088762]|uniref:cytochrome P450 family protein n=1 Tax=Streptomyces sp. NPDC088762 TaxID=3365891 RepID=UPI0037F2A8DB
MVTSSPPSALFESDYYQNPYPAFAWLRDNSPVHEFNFPIGDFRSWIVTRFDDVHALLGDPRFSTNAGDYASPEFQKSGMVLGAGTVVERILSTLDPPDHTRQRKLAMGSFTPRRIAQWRESTERIVEAALDRLGKQENPDLMDYAGAVPAEVIGNIFGISLDRYNDIINAIDRAFHPDDETENVTSAFEDIAQYGRELIVEKRNSPGDDLLTSLIEARDGNDRLTEDELVAMLAQMIMAGLDTTRNLIGSAVLALLDNPDQRRLLAERPELAPQAIDEFLRYEGAFTMGLFRFAKEDLEFGGVSLPAGAPVIATILSANRDPRRFTDPDRLDITREGPRNLGLGHGLHNCIGAALARLEAEIAIPAVLRRFPQMELAIPRDEITYSESWLLRALTKLPVDLHAGGSR